MYVAALLRPGFVYWRRPWRRFLHGANRAKERINDQADRRLSFDPALGQEIGWYLEMTEHARACCNDIKMCSG